MGIADIFKRWLGLSDNKPQPTPAKPVNRNAPPAKAPARQDLKELAKSKESQQRQNALQTTANVGQLIQKHRMSGAAARKSIEQRLGELLVVDAANPDFFRQQDIDQLQAFVLFGATPEIREKALTYITEQNVLASLVSEHPSSRIRQLASAQISDEKLLAFAGEAIRHKDKGLYKQIRHRLDSVHTESKAREEKLRRLEKICHDMESQARMSVTPLFAAKLISLEKQWKDASTAPDSGVTAELQARFDAATQSARFALAESTRASEAEVAARQEHHDVIDALQARLDALSGSDAWVGHAVFQSALQQLEGRWAQALTAAAPESGLRHRYEALHKEARQLDRLLEQADSAQAEITALLASLAAQPDDATALARLADLLKPLSLNRQSRVPSLLRQAQTLIEQAQLHAPRKKAPARAEKAAKTPKEVPAELVELQDRLAALIQEGHVQEAEKILKDARNLAKSLKVKSARLQELGDEVYKLKDWAKFAILPKKEALVARMTALVSEECTDAAARQDLIKSIQAEWSELGKMNTEAERALWKQFQELGQQAWEPVQRYLDEQKGREDANAERREALCQELQEYLDNMPSDVNWQRHVAILRTAREEWQRHHPVSAKVHKALQAKFSKVINALEEKLQTEYQQQEKRKTALISQAAALIDQEDIRAACETAKQLQQAWKDTGSCGHARDQKLWEEFRDHCDALFARREEAKTQQKTELQDMVDQASKLLDQIEDVLVTDNGGEVASALIEAFDSLSLNVPRDQQLALRERLASIRARIEVERQSALKSDFREDVKKLPRLMEACQAAEEAVFAEEAAEKYQAPWLPERAPASFAEELEKRWAHLPRTRELEPGQQLTLFNQHCLLLEILLDLPSPAEEQDLRVSRQMALFKLQRYPKTAEEKQKLVRKTLRAAIVCPCLPPMDKSYAMERFERVLGSDAFLDLF
ncbi:MAG TPA: DUF349 domain-containing protein [Fluviicoccus sp.]|nr:DUF349 domain-containing protein [Fluviicoccus sp.]